MSEDTNTYGRLETAIEAFLHEVGEPGLLLDWALVTHKVVANEDGSNASTTSYTGSEHQTHYRTLGLLDYARTVVMTQITENLRQGDD